MIRVVKVNSARDNYTLYIGRTWAELTESPFHNPFHIGKDGNREEVLLKFSEYWYAPEQKWLRDLALEIIHDDDILGCWCHPLSCHGHVIKGYVDWKRKVLDKQQVFW